MIGEQHNKTVAKPFVKWAGGKGSLISQLIENLPQDFAEQPNVTYIEPFVGGGAMLFYMLTHYPNIKRAVINDVNEDLINCYLLIKNDPEKLITSLREIKDEYYRLATIEAKSQYYYQMREKYNNEELAKEKRAACFIFLNKTCFNGLYRVNTSGKFNVPFGQYVHPNICDEELIMADHGVLQKVDIYVGGYKNITKHLGKRYNFIYIDPPYRPLSGSACFIEYTRNIFDDKEQENLKIYCDILTQKGCKIMQSNSNSLDNNGEYRIIKYVDTSDSISDDERYDYVCIVRSQLSDYELVMLFYNCLTANEKAKFKPLIEKYSIFNNLRDDLLADIEHKNEYTEKAYNKYAE